MVKEHVDKLKLYWDLIEQTTLEPDIEDFANEETLERAIEVIKTRIPKKDTEIVKEPS